MILWKDTVLGTGQLDLHFQLCRSLVCNEGLVAEPLRTCVILT